MEERKRNEQIKGLISNTWLLNSSLSSFVPNFRVLSQVVAEKSLTEKSLQTDRQTELQKRQKLYTSIYFVPGGGGGGGGGHSKGVVDIIMFKFNTPQNIIKRAQNIWCSMCEQSHVQSLNMKEMKTAEVTDYTNQTPPKHFGVDEKCLSPKALENKKIFNKCAQNKRCTCSMYEQSLCKV